MYKLYKVIRINTHTHTHIYIYIYIYIYAYDNSLRLYIDSEVD